MKDRFKKIVVIGNGKAAQDCIKIISQYSPRDKLDSECRIDLVVIDGTNENMCADLDGVCQAQGLDYVVSSDINSKQILDELSGRQPDIVFSVNNFQIIKPKLLGIPAEGVINFHNAPLPRYAGLNACTWALVNGETEHGVTWHYVDRGVDSGDIIAQTRFPISEGMTALELIMRCIVEGMGLFEKELNNILNGRISVKSQDPKERLFYYKDQIPNEGELEFSWPFARLDNFIRGLNFYPLPNNLAYPRVRFADRDFYVERVKLSEFSVQGSPGTIVRACGPELHVQCGDAVVSITKVRGEGKKSLKIGEFIAEYGIRAGLQMMTRAHDSP